MTAPSRLPRLARGLLRLSPVPRETCAEVEADLLELFAGRRHDHGAGYAYWRLCHDIVSLWQQPRTPAVPRRAYSALALLNDMRGDLRYAVRLFARQPAILLLTIAGLSLGLAIATAAFSIMNAAALRGEGLVDSDRLPGVLRATDRSTATVWKYDEFLRLREGATRMQVEAVLTDGASVRTSTVETNGDVPPSALGFVSGGFFTGTGGRALVGRTLEMADEAHSGPPLVVVSYSFWTSRLNSDPGVIGRTIQVGRTDATIVGVAERGFTVPHNRVLWMPMTAHGAVYGATSQRTPEMGVGVFGRLLPGVTMAEAEAQLSGVASALPRDPKTPDSPLRVRLDAGAGLGRADSSTMLAIAAFVFVAIGLVLLLACANVATVLVSTAITREREMGVRAALGASRWRIVRQLITESLALGAVAGPVGLLLAYWAIPTIGRMIEAPAGADLSPDFTVYVFLVIVTGLTGVGAGLAPAWHGRGADLVTPLKGEGSREHRFASRRLRSALVMTQAAVSVLLIVMATLFVRASVRAATIDVGFEAAGLYEITPRLGRAAFEDDGAGLKAFWARALPELQRVPGVVSVTLAELTPFGGLTRSSAPRDNPARAISFNRTRPEFFDTIGLQILAGRSYTPDEVAADAPVAVVSQSLARAYWPDRSPLGQPLPEQIPVFEARPIVIGIVSDAITARLHERNAFTVYGPLGPSSEVFGRLLVRIAPGAAGAIDQARQRLRAISPDAEISVASVSARLEQNASRPRVLATLAGVVGLIAIVMCVIGLYGLTASVVAQRTRELGVRVALGAERLDLLRLMMWDSLKPVAIGLGVGTGLALLVSRVVAGILFGVSPQDPIAFAGAAALLLGATTLAVLLPTRRAAAVDPAFVLRQS